jgi:hypothetical protein
MSERTRAFSVTVRDHESHPIPGAFVCVNDRCGRTDLENGRVRIEGISTDWHWVQLGIEADGFRLYSESVDIDNLAGGGAPPFGDVEWPDVYLEAAHDAAGPLRIEGDHFMRGDQPFLVKGSTDFRIPEQAMVGADFEAILDDRIACGANWFRMLAMKKNNTGYRLDPRDPRHDDAVRRTFDAIGNRGAYGQWCVFADTAEMMPDPHEQQDFWGHEQEVLRPYADFAPIEFCNEASHSSQRLAPANFKPPAGFLASHGSETADKHPVRPVWNWAGYSARRSGVIGKIISNYAQLTAFETWPPYCYIPQETIKPDEHYGHDPTVAATLGKYARAGTGGVFHHNAWRDCRRFTDGERQCATAFYRALE